MSDQICAKLDSNFQTGHNSLVNYKVLHLLIEQRLDYRQGLAIVRLFIAADQFVLWVFFPF